MFIKFTRSRYFNHFMDLVVVIVGITIAFQVDKWDNARREKNYHLTLTRDLLEEVRLNIGEFEEKLPILEQYQASLRSVIEVYRSEAPREKTAELARYISGLTFVDYPALETGQLDNYLSATVGEAYGYKPTLLSLNSQIEEYTLLLQYSIENRIEKLPNALINGIDYVKEEIADPDVLFSVRFRNFCAMLYSAERELMRSHRELLSDFKDIEATLSRVVAEEAPLS